MVEALIDCIQFSKWNIPGKRERLPEYLGNFPENADIISAARFSVQPKEPIVSGSPSPAERERA